MSEGRLAGAIASSAASPPATRQRHQTNTLALLPVTPRDYTRNGVKLDCDCMSTQLNKSKRKVVVFSDLKIDAFIRYVSVCCVNDNCKEYRKFDVRIKYLTIFLRMLLSPEHDFPTRKNTKLIEWIPSIDTIFIYFPVSNKEHSHNRTLYTPHWRIVKLVQEIVNRMNECTHAT